MAALEPVDKWHGTLLQGGCAVSAAVPLVALIVTGVAGLLSFGLFLRDGRFQLGNCRRHLRHLHYALCGRCFADNFKHPPAIGFQHDEVAGAL